MAEPVKTWRLTEHRFGGAVLEAVENDQGDYLGMPDVPPYLNALEAKAALVDEALAALRRWMTKSEFLSGRWPCPFCGKEEAESLRTIELANGNIVGCWLCTTEDLRDDTFALIAKLTATQDGE